MGSEIPLRRRVSTRLLLVLGIPFLVSMALFALFLGSRSISERSYDAALAWSEHAGVMLSVEAEAERFVHSLERGAEAAARASAQFDRVRARSLELSRYFSEQEQAEEGELSALLDELIGMGRDASRRASPEAVGGVRRFYDEEVRPRILARVKEEQTGSKAFAARGRDVSGNMLTLSIIGASVLLLIGVALSRQVGRRLTGSIAYLHAQATRLAGGNLVGTIALPSRDELGNLAAAFNAMATDLRRSMINRSELEAMIVSRTQELVQAQDHLRQSQKLDAVGRLAGGIAHDFNNLLAVIMANAQMVADDLPGDHGSRGDVAEIFAATERAASLTRQLLAFSRKQPSHPQVVSVNDTVSNLTKMFHRIIGEHIILVSDLAPELAAVNADVGQLEQVLTNVVINARDAMATGGQLRIETKNVTVTEREANQMGVLPGRHVVLAIADTGCGMDERTRARVFEPFFTTKEVGKGTGLGLATAFGIVSQHRGAIAIESQPNRGTTVRVYLPAVDLEATPMVATSRAPAVTSAGETIFVVEDDERVRSTIARALGRRGYRVLEASSGKEALALLAHRAELVHLMLTDLVMPEMHGMALAKAVKARWPAIAVIVMSGYGEHPALDSLKLTADTLFIRKPFEVDALATLIARTLHGDIDGISRQAAVKR